MAQTNQLPLLYTFVRCPWAMRARMALAFMNIAYETCEVDLKHKPHDLLAVSPKGTVPVLVLQDGTVIDESLDIIRWAMPKPAAKEQIEIERLVTINDNFFKQNNYRYKYASRYPEDPHPPEYYRSECEKFLQELEQILSKHEFLLNAQVSIADIAIFPMVRQFAMVDDKWFASTPYHKVRHWLATITASKYFVKAMLK